MPSKKRSAAITSDQLLHDLAQLHPKLIDLSLGRMQRLLAALAHPERRLPPIIHVAGTNGKGSTIAFLSAMLSAAGKTHHRYHSPHLVRFHERIMLDNKAISERALVHYLQTCQAANGDNHITFFEITTAAAFCAFANNPADFLLLEVGLGGRLDATNVITPQLAALCAIDFDHQEFLGTELAAIAHEKAGIIKPHSTVISAPQSPPAREVILATAAAQNATLALGGRDWQVFTAHGRLVFQDLNGLLDLPLPALAGDHQIENAGVAIALARQLKLDEAHIATGLSTAQWAGRLQPFTHKHHPHYEIWLDGAHNPAGARALGAWARGKWARNKTGNQPLHLIVAMLAHKDSSNFFSAFFGAFYGDFFSSFYGAFYEASHKDENTPTCHIHTINMPTQDTSSTPSSSASDLAANARHAASQYQSQHQFKSTISAHATLDEALAAIQSHEASAARPLVIIAGSLYLAAEILGAP